MPVERWRRECRAEFYPRGISGLPAWIDTVISLLCLVTVFFGNCRSWRFLVAEWGLNWVLIMFAFAIVLAIRVGFLMCICPFLCIVIGHPRYLLVRLRYLNLYLLSIVDNCCINPSVGADTRK